MEQKLLDSETYFCDKEVYYPATNKWLREDGVDDENDVGHKQRSSTTVWCGGRKMTRKLAGRNRHFRHELSLQHEMMNTRIAF